MAATADGLSSPQLRRGGRGFSTPWANVVRGESEGAAAAAAPGSPSSSPGAALVAADVSVSSDGLEKENSPVESVQGGLDNNGGDVAAGRTKKPAWNKLSNGVVEVGPVMGAVSWPALSESTRASPKWSSDPKALSDGSVPVSQGPVIASAQNPLSNSGNPNPTSNHATPIRQKSMKRGDRGVVNGSLGQTRPPTGEVPQSALEKTVPSTADSSPKDIAHKDIGNSEFGPRGGSGNGNDQPRNSFRRGNNGPHPRGDGHYHGSYGNRRDQERTNEWHPHRSFNGRDVHMQQPRPMSRGFIRAPPNAAPFITPPRPFGNPMEFPGIISPVYYAPVPEAVRGLQFMPHLAAPPIFFSGPDLQLRASLVNQIEYYFSPQNLCKDFFLRQNMDDQGWVPVSLIASFNRVKQLTTNIQFILDALRSSIVLEVQGDNIRNRKEWMKFPRLSYNQFSTGIPSPTPSNYDILANRIQNVGLEDGTSIHNNLLGHLDSLPEGVIIRKPSAESNHSAALTVASDGESTSQSGSQIGNDRPLSVRNSGKVISC